MNDHSTKFPEPVPSDLHSRFESICHSFAQAWEANQEPNIQTHLNAIEKKDRVHLAGVLIALEVRLRIIAGESPHPKEYKSRFPEYQEAVDFAFLNANQDLSQSDDQGHDEELTFEDIPEKLGRYEIKKGLGQGGFGLVCLAWDTTLKRNVALKFARYSSFDSQEHISAFIREARTAAQLEHASIVTIFDVSRFKDLICIVQQYIDGHNLRTLLTDSGLDFQRTAKICSEVATGLSFAHVRRFIHRDIKPANILIDKEGHPYIADFGLAIHESAQRKQRGAIIGTPRFMSPEIVMGESHRVDGRSDIWSLGVVMYEMLTGAKAFNGDEREDIYDEIRNREPKPPRQIDPDIPRELERICLKCLSKRVSDRYATASDMAEDLNHWLDSATSLDMDSTASMGRVSEELETSRSAATEVASVSIQDTKIVPKGLQAFDAHDSEFFVHLLPGPRDRFGLPDTLRFWRQRIEDHNKEDDQGIGLIYGPSGCGKTSFVKAGLLPILNDDIVPVYVEATSSDTEARLQSSLRRQFPNMPKDVSLAELLDTIRDGYWMPYGNKLLIIIDQFEQWLHDRDPEQLSELARALRHCDGRRVECILMVRDDFWLATSRFMRALEVNLREGRNSLLIDLFDLKHGRQVLTQFGRAYGALPENSSEMSKAEHRFIEQAIEGMAEQDKVVCVHLALFAEMFKDKSWTSAELAKVGGPQGVGYKFLEDTFSSKSARPEHRYHQKAARKFLASLLPQSGGPIRGQMMPVDQLKSISGYANNQQAFDDLVKILASDLKLVTLTDPSGTINKSEANVNTTPHYQLTHDFLVGSLRDWLTKKQKATFRGRAALRLKERIETWLPHPANKFLPGFWEYINIRSLTRPSNWTADETKMMRKAGWIHGARAALVITTLLLAAWAFASFVSSQQTNNLVNRLLEAETVDVPGIIEELEERPASRRRLDRLVQDVTVKTDQKKLLHLSLARYRYAPKESEYLFSRLFNADARATEIIADTLENRKDEFLESTWQTLENSDDAAERIRAAVALSKWDPENTAWGTNANNIVQTLIHQNPLELNDWAESLSPVSDKLVTDIARLIATDDTKTRVLLGLYQLYANDPDGQLVLSKLIDEYNPNDSDDSTAFTEQCRQQANLAAALLRLNPDSEHIAFLKSKENLTRRSHLIEDIHDAGIEPAQLIERLANETDPEIRSGILLSLGRYKNEWSFSPSWIKLIEDIYRTDGSSLVHSSAEWLLRTLEPETSISTLRSNLPSTSEQWYLVDEITMVQVQAPGEIRYSRDRTSNIDYDFAISSTEITIRDFTKFASQHDFGVDTEYSDGEPLSLDCPAVNMRWHDAAAYCNWLSKQKGLPESEFCFELDKDYKFGHPGRPIYAMRLVEDWQNKKGFRLPTEAEWEHACQANSLTTWNFGDANELLKFYGWNRDNIAGNFKVRPCGMLKPNRLGLFDMHGNADEYVVDRKDMKDRPPYYFRKGGSIYSAPQDLTTQSFHQLPSSSSSGFVGFRVVSRIDVKPE